MKRIIILLCIIPLMPQAQVYGTIIFEGKIGPKERTIQLNFDNNATITLEKIEDSNLEKREKQIYNGLVGFGADTAMARQQAKDAISELKNTYLKNQIVTYYLNGSNVFNNICYSNDQSKKYCITDTVFNIGWKLFPEADIILGYSCQKAEAIVDNIKYIAWFAEALPLPYGILRLNGLPGLMLKLISKERSLSFTAMSLSLQKNSKPLPPNCNGAMAISRIDYNKQLEKDLKAQNAWIQSFKMKGNKGHAVWSIFFTGLFVLMACLSVVAQTEINKEFFGTIFST